MKKWVVLFLCIFMFSGCASTRHNKDYNIRRNLMILENCELPRNKPLKFSKRKMHKELDKKNKKYQRKINRQR